MKRNFLNKCICWLLILLTISMNFLPIQYAAEAVPDSVTVVTDTEEKETLLGISGSEDQKVGVLGIAEKFSVFTRENLTMSAADIEGRVAVGGKLEATTDYEYQIGVKNEDDDSADIIIGDGPVVNVALNYGADDDGNIIEDTKKVAVSTNASNMNWSDYTEEELANNFYSTDLIDFDEEFERLEDVSEELSNLDINGTIINVDDNDEQLIVSDSKVASNTANISLRAANGDDESRYSDVTIFSGNNEELNVFSIDITEWNSLRGAIAFDVPSTSKIIVNLTGTDRATFGSGWGQTHFYFLMDEEELVSEDLSNSDLAYIDIDGDLYRDSEGNIKIFNRVSPGQLSWAEGNVNIDNETSKKYAERLLWNVVDSTYFVLGTSNTGCFFGTILAPKAGGTNVGTGYMQGCIICKYYTGGIQIGYAPFTLEEVESTNIDIVKSDYETGENIEGTILQLWNFDTDSNGNIVYKNKILEWESDNTAKEVNLAYGTYVLKEISSSENYNDVEKDNYTVIEVSKTAYFEDGELSYKAVLGLGSRQENSEITITENSFDLDEFPITWNELYSTESGSEVLGNGKRVSKIEFEIDSVDDSIKDETLYVIVANANGKIGGHSSGIGGGMMDWVEFKKWTEVDIGETIITDIPLIKYFYPYKTCTGDLPTSETNLQAISFKPHFYIKTDDSADATEVTDLVTISNIKAYWYDGEMTDEYYGTTLNTNEKTYVTIDETNNEVKVTNDHIKTTINLTKTKTGDTTKVLQGAVYEIQDTDGNVVETFDETDENGNSSLEDLTLDAGTYYIVEVSAPDGYRVSSEKEEITVQARTSSTINVIVSDDTISNITISKQDITTCEEIEGAELTVTDKNGETIDSWTSTSTPHEINGVLVVGETYTLTEVRAPDGYATAEQIEFTVADTAEVQKVEMFDEEIKITISKQDITTCEEIEGAELTVTDKNGETIDSWTSTSTPHEINGVLVVGETYTLTEVRAPDGYATAEQIEFTVADTAEVQKVEMFDEETKITISKQDITTCEEIEGAELTVTDKDGEIIDSWTSTSTPHEINGKLVVGETYTLTEVTAPAGYATAEQIEFTVEDTAEVQKVEMFDDTTKITISKQDITTGEEIEGATLTLQNADGAIIDLWTSTNTPHEIDGGLVVGETYTLTEETAPDGYVKAEQITFTVEDTAEVQKVEMKDDYTKVHLYKIDSSGEILAGADLRILDSNGNVVVSWTTDDDYYELEKVLKAGETYTLEETKAPDGYQIADSIEFIVSTDGSTDIVSLVDSKEVSIPQTGQSRIIYITLGIVILICIAGIVFINVKGKKKKSK